MKISALDEGGNPVDWWFIYKVPKLSAGAASDASQEPTPEYGQTYFCVSLDIAAASKLAAQMIDHQEPQTYLNRSGKISNNDPLALLMAPIDAKAPGDSDVINLQSRGGMAF